MSKEQRKIQRELNMLKIAVYKMELNLELQLYQKGLSASGSKPSGQGSSC